MRALFDSDIATRFRNQVPGTFLGSGAPRRGLKERETPCEALNCLLADLTVVFHSFTVQHGETAPCLSSSGRDGGVREKPILLKSDSWDLVQLKIAPEKPVQFIRDRIGARYDYRGILFSQVLALGRHSESRWFCSEIVAASLGLDHPHRLSPQMLFDVVTWRGRQAVG
ncbi:MAG: hypothetical protein MK098_05555 [Marinovum sp.]|nr:hypothetical protein [Marinovum sp.]